MAVRICVALGQQPNIFRLGDAARGYLQVLLPSFILRKQAGGIELEVEFDCDNHCLRDTSGRRELYSVIRAKGATGEQFLTQRLAKFQAEKDVLAYRVNTEDYPLRFANGGVLPVVRLNSREYFCLFYRDVYPVGWNIANGASDSIQEILNPRLIMIREFSEELLISDDVHHLFYSFDSDGERLARGSKSEALAAWQAQSPRRNLDEYKNLSVPLKWIDGPDRLTVHYEGKSYTSDSCFLSITPEDAAIEVDRVALISLKEDVTFFDGEILRGSLINSPIGLFPVETFDTEMRSRRFLPERLFFSAAERPVTDFDRILASEYLPAVRHLRTDNEVKAYWKTPNRFDLCPITRSIIGKYQSWSAREAAETRRAAGRSAISGAAQGRYQVFLSYRSDDRDIARSVYDHLSKEYRVFFSDSTLPQVGESDYGAVIDAALESACCLIVIGTRPEHFEGAWVGYEWRSFLNELLSKRKPNGQIFTFAGNVSPDKLPYGLRSFQMILYRDTSPYDSLEQLAEFVHRTLSPHKLHPGE